MSYIALARKWRPQTFTDLIGQTHVSKALTNALKRNRLHHAYLFTGTRGVGKTSIARLFAKALSCENGPSAEPCLACDSCNAITDGRFIDLIEIDAASKTRVEDTRELLENVSYAPTQGRFKIYLIDEVHMLSTHSFNALLKTLEEPPEHVKFLLATTEPKKLPMTVLSRCLQFHLTALDIPEIEAHLAYILEREHIDFEKDALMLIARAAKGSMRDALSLLDQMIMLSDTTLTENNVKQALGYTQKNYSIDILNALANETPETLLELSQTIQKAGGQYHVVLDELLQVLHQVNCAQLLNKKPLHDGFSPEDIQLFYQIALNGRETLDLAPTLLTGFEMVLLRLYTFKPATAITSVPAKSVPVAPPTPTQTSISAKPTVLPKPLTQSPQSKPAAKKDNWESVLSELKLSGLALTAAQQADLQFNPENENEAFLITHQNHVPLFTENTLKKIKEAVSLYHQRKITLTLKTETTKPHSPAEKKRIQKEKRAAADEAFLNEDVAFQALKNTFPGAS